MRCIEHRKKYHEQDWLQDTAAAEGVGGGCRHEAKLPTLSKDRPCMEGGDRIIFDMVRRIA